MKLSYGTHKILFRNGSLYLDETLIAGEGIFPKKDVCFDFIINPPKEIEKVEEQLVQGKDPSILEVNVHDSVKFKDLGPGQK